MTRLFPSLAADLYADGAMPSMRAPAFVTPAGKLASPPDDPNANPGFYASRVLLECHVRRRLAVLPGVTLQPRTEVTALIGDETGDGVVGVMLRSRDGSDEANVAEPLLADLVVDASGRGSAAPAWLEELGYDTPPDETVHSGIGYASRLYRKPAEWPGDWDGVIINGRPPHNPRAGLILPIEDGLWHVSLGGFAGNHPPTDEAGFLDWARQLPDPSLYEAIRVAEPVTPIRGYRTPQNRLRRFDLLDRWPEGFIAVGDSVCAFNPIYGQGMTVAAMGVELLEESLRRQTDAPGPGFAQRFQRELKKVVADPWLIASGEDLRWGVPATGVKPAPGSALVRRYLDRVLRRGRHDAQVAGAFLSVIGMLAPPASLFAPRILLPVLADTLTQVAGRGRQHHDSFALTPAAIAQLQALPKRVNNGVA